MQLLNLIDCEYENAVYGQKRELREYKKKAKAQTQLPQIEPVPLTIEEDLSQDQGQQRLKGTINPRTPRILGINRKIYST